MGGIMGGGGGGGGDSSAPNYGSGGPGVKYTAPASSSPEAMANRYTAQYAPQTATPFLQSIMQQHNAPFQQSSNLGLPSLQSMFNMPERGAPFQGSGIQQLAPMAPYASSTYRPDMAAVNQNLSNVAPSVALQQKQAAEAQAKFDAENPAQPVSYDGGGG